MQSNWASVFTYIFVLEPEPRGAEIQIAQRTFYRVANELINERRAAVANNEKQTDRDLLSLLMKSNIAADRPADQRLSDQDIIARTNHVWELSGKSDASTAEIPTFMVAGHETTREVKIASMTCLSLTLFRAAPQRCGHCLLLVRTKRFRLNFEMSYSPLTRTIRLWINWMLSHIWIMSFARLCVCTLPLPRQLGLAKTMMSYPSAHQLPIGRERRSTA